MKNLNAKFILKVAGTLTAISEKYFGLDLTQPD